MQTLNRMACYSFSVSASKWQVEFFKHQQPQVQTLLYLFQAELRVDLNQVKEFIKRAKAWRNVKWAGRKPGKPKSFLLSVIVLRAYETAEKMGGISIARQ